MKFLFTYLFIFCLSISFAQNVTIKGRAEAYKNKEINAYSYDDLITKRENLLDTDTINETGDFTLKINTDIIQRIFLKINNQKAHIYVQPGKNYLVRFPEKDTSRYINPNVEQVQNLIIKVKDTTDINYLVIDYNEQFDIFWENNYQYFIAKRAKPAIDSFMVRMRKRYEPIKNDFFKTFVEYSIVSLRGNTLQSPNALTYEYIVKKPIHYTNYEYMEFFHSAFKQFLGIYALSTEGAGVFTEINTNASYEGLMKTLSFHKFLKTDTLRELVMLKGLQELIYNKQFKTENIFVILSDVQAQSKVHEHRKIAFNILNSQSPLKTGALAPGFTLPDRTGKEISLSDFKGKYVYLNFWKTECTTCLKEMKVIPALKKKYGDKIVFTSVSLDKDVTAMKQFLLKNPTYNWNFLYAGEESKIMKDYNIRALPTFYLINPQGRFEQCPAEHPGMIEPYFDALLKKK